MSSDVLGAFGAAPADDEIDLDRAASAFPDLDDLDGALPAPRAAPSASAATLTFAAFDEPVQQDVKVTGDDEIEKFEDQFPDIEVPVRLAKLMRVLHRGLTGV